MQSEHWQEESDGRRSGWKEEEEEEDEGQPVAPNLDVFKDAGEEKDELTTFRNAWQSELAHRFEKVFEKGSDRVKMAAADMLQPESDKQQLALDLFESGVMHEREGRMHQAISCYKQALQINPEVERMVRLRSTLTPSVSVDHEQHPSAGGQPPSQTYEQLLNTFEQRLQQQGSRALCQPDESRKGTHLSALPAEVLVQIFKWVVSSDLDVYQLEQMSMVCCGFYKLARDPDLWRSICARLWADHLGSLEPHFSSWRHMFLSRSHLWFNGLYVSKVSYVRMGDISYQDQFYRPWHLVVYFRCLRFFPDGTAIMVTSAEPPKVIVDKLSSKWPKCPTVLTGRYRMVGYNCVTVNLRRHCKDAAGGHGRGRRPQAAADTTQTFCLELQLVSSRRRRHNVLRWINYEAEVKHKSGQLSASKFALDDQHFPPFFFSRVKSYASRSESIL